jgi:hypothetical protein
MSVLFVLFTIVVFGLAIARLVSLQSGRVQLGSSRVQAWRQAAHDLGVGEVPFDTVAGQPSGLTVKLGGHLLRFQRRQEREDSGGTLVSIQGDSDLTLCHEDLEAAARKLIGQARIPFGDPDFDKEVCVLGTPEVRYAVLDAENRAVLRAFLNGKLAEGDWVEDGQFTVRDGRLEAFLSDSFSDHPWRFSEAVQALVVLAHRLDPPADLPARLAENAQHEALAEVRLHDIALLADRYADTAVGREALHRACGDGNAEIRLTAALGLDEEGRNTLLEIATSQPVDEALASRAIEGLGTHLPLDRAVELLQDALKLGSLVIARACLHRLVESGSAAEQPLLAVVRHAPDDVQLLAVEGLGRIGTVAAVLPLRSAGEASDASRELHRASRLAIARIQARLSGAEQGQLSLASEDASGGLSLAAEDSSGQVSLAETANSGASPKKVPEAQG